MNGPQLLARLNSLFEANRATSQLIVKLSKLGGPAIGSADGDGESRIGLGTEIHQGLRSLEEDFELIKQEAEDITSNGNWGTGARRRESDRDRDRVAIVTQVERLGEDLKLSRTQFRKAQLQAKRNEDAARKKDREQLFAEVQEGNQGLGRRRGQEKLSQDELLVNASGDVTSALRRTHQLMQSELERSQFAHETLQRSTAALNALNETYSTLDSLLASSKSLITTLVSSSKSDTWYLETALYILLATIGWLVFRRIFYGPIRYLVYLPLKWSLNLFLYFVNIVIGVFAGSAAASSGTPSSSPTTSLKVVPSATDRAPTRATGMAAPSIHVGGGGAKEDPRGGEQGGSALNDRVGDMAEETIRQEQGQVQAQDDEGKGEAPSPGSNNVAGTVLRERAAHERPNPKKRMMEEPPPPPPAAAGGRIRDEL